MTRRGFSGSVAGFTLLEVLLSVSIISILTATTLPLFRSFLTRNDLDIAVQQVASALRRAQTYTRGMASDSPWGVEIQSSAITLFKGTSFVARNTNYDEVITLSGGTTASGLSEVQFQKLLAGPSTTGTVTLTGSNSETRTVTVNGEGTITY